MVNRSIWSFFLALGLTVFLPWLVSAAQTPHQIAGFELGQPMEKYKDQVRMDTVLTYRYTPYLKEVETRNVHGFKTGLILFGTCHHQDKVVRIRMKYADDSREFFEKLLERFKKRFGDPDQYIGDPFKTVEAWKWQFVDKQKKRINLVLQHNLEDRDERVGNTVKLTCNSALEEERKCYEAGQSKEPETSSSSGIDLNKLEWDALLPR